MVDFGEENEMQRNEKHVHGIYARLVSVDHDRTLYSVMIPRHEVEAVDTAELAELLDPDEWNFKLAWAEWDDDDCCTVDTVDDEEDGNAVVFTTQSLDIACEILSADEWFDTPSVDLDAAVA